MTLLELRRVSKSFPGVHALSEVDLDVKGGEVHALIGENGAGKSTLIKLLSGVFPHDSGTIRFNGETVRFTSPHASQHAGIHTLYQEFNLLPQLSVAENIFLGAEPRYRYVPLINWREANRQSKQLLDLLGVEIDPARRVSELSVAEQQLVELAKVLHTNSKLLIMDEPTATLSTREIRALMELVRRIKERGVAVIYISHRLEEVFAIADRVTILRDGRRISTVNTNQSSTDQLIRLMLGHTVNQRFTHKVTTPGPEVLRVESLTHQPVFNNISFALHAGEIVGVAGLVGSGRTALVRTIFGFEQPDSGTILIDGQPVTIRSPQDAVALGIGLLPEDRQQQALLLEMSARENISLAALNRLGVLINPQDETEITDAYIRRLRIKLNDPEEKAKNLSGGTQQKLILSRWLATHPRILIFDQPTRGIDIGSKVEIYRVLRELAGQGTAILMISSDLAEVVGLCDRALVMNNGWLVASVDHDQLTEETLVRYMLGDAL